MIKKAQEIITKVEEVSVGPGNPPSWRLFRIETESGNSYSGFNGKHWHSQIGNPIFLEYEETEKKGKYGQVFHNRRLIEPATEKEHPRKPPITSQDPDKFSQIMSKLNELAAEIWEIKETLKGLQ